MEKFDEFADYRVGPEFLGVTDSGLWEEENILDLDDQNFLAKLKPIDTALIMFYAPCGSQLYHPWCAGFHKLKPDFIEAAAILAEEKSDVVLAKVDCVGAGDVVGGKETCKKLGVKGYPTVKIFRNGEETSDYSGTNKAAGIVDYMKSLAKPASIEVTSMEQYEEIVNQNMVTVLGFGTGGSRLIQKHFDKVTGRLRDSVSYLRMSASGPFKQLGLPDGLYFIRPKHLQSKFESESIVYHGKVEERKHMHKWVLKNFHGLCGHRKPDNVGDFVNPLVTVYFGIDYEKNPKKTKYWRNRVLKIAKDYSGINFAMSNKDDFKFELEQFGFDLDKLDKPVVIAKDAQGEKFRLEKEFSLESLGEFVNKFSSGDLKPYIRSEPIPETQGLVKVAVGDNFHDVVTNNKKDVLLLLFCLGKRCGHAKKIFPIFEDLAVQLIGEDVEFVKIDGVVNDLPKDYAAPGYPTIFWLPRDTKKPEMVNGGRENFYFFDQEDNFFLKFVAEKAVRELNKFDRTGKEKLAKGEL